MATTVSWPDKLPLPLFEGYGIEPLDAALRTDMEAGPARQRRRYTFVPARFPVRWQFTAWQFALFEAWYRHKAAEGAEWFAVTLLGGLGMTEHEARFVGAGGAPYRATPLRGGPGNGARWIVSSTLEVRERPALSEDALDIVLAEDAPGLLAAGATFHVLVNATLAADPW